MDWKLISLIPDMNGSQSTSLPTWSPYKLDLGEPNHLFSLSASTRPPLSLSNARWPDDEEEETPLPPHDPFWNLEEHQSHSSSTPKIEGRARSPRTPFNCLSPPSNALGENLMLRRPCRTKPCRKRATGASTRLNSGEPWPHPRWMAQIRLSVPLCFI
jgi:hypothetical protein